MPIDITKQLLNLMSNKDTNYYKHLPKESSEITNINLNRKQNEQI